MKITNFKRNYGNSFRSLDDVAEKLESLERRENGHNNNDNSIFNDNGELKSPYPDVKAPSLEFIGVLHTEHPYFGSEEIADILWHRIQMRHYFSDKYKSAALAWGDEYLPDEMEEYREDMLDSIEKERLRRQRVRREKIGTITKAWYDESDGGKFRYELVKSVESGREEEPFTQADHKALCMKEKDI